MMLPQPTQPLHYLLIIGAAIFAWKTYQKRKNPGLGELPEDLRSTYRN